MDHFTVTEPQIVHNDISENEIFLNFQKADFDTVWGDFSSTSLSDSEQVLFEQPKQVTSEEIGLWKELESIQPIIKRSSSNLYTSEMEAENKFDRIFNEGLFGQTDIITNDPMVSSSLELSTPQHPFEERLSLPEDPSEDVNSPKSTIYYPSSPDGEESEDPSAESPKQIASPPPTGYPHSIHSYSQVSSTAPMTEDNSEEVVVEDEMSSEEVNEIDNTTAQPKEKTFGIQNVSPFKSKRRRQRKSKVFKITISEQAKVTPKKKTFANGKAKLYALKPLNDPEAERARQNAINAKKNRDLKKRERELIAREVVTLKEENGELRRSAAAMRRRAAEAEAQLRQLQAAIRANQLEDVLKASGNKGSYFNISSNSDMDSESDLW